MKNKKTNKKSKIGKIILFFFGIFLFLALLIFAMFNINKTKQNSAIEKFQLDENVNPGESLYFHVNNPWLSANPIPGDYSRWSTFDLLRDETLKKLQNIFETSSANPQSENEKLIGKFYPTAMDEKTIEEAESTPIRPDIDRINAIQSSEDVTREIAYQNSLFFSPFFSIYAIPDSKDSTTNIAEMWQGGLGLPEKSYYTDPEREEIRQKYVVHIAKMFELTGFTPEESSAKAAKIMEIETMLATSSRSPQDQRDVIKNFNKMDVNDLNNLAPNLNWQTYFQTVGIPDIQKITIGQPEYLQSVNKIISDTPITDLKDYLMWNWLNNTASYLSNDFVNEDFDFYKKTLSGQEIIKERYKRVAGFMDSYLGDAVGQIYVEKYFPPQAKKRADELVQNILASMKIHIENLPWMDINTKNVALEKLSKMGVKIGYPVKWRDYSKVKIGDNYFENVTNLMKNEFAYNIQKQGKPVDRQEWEMPPQTVNAYYNPSKNEIVFPSAILQSPYFDFQADDAVNYGGIGVVIGHEITHAFDDQGRKFDQNGNLNDWWSESDANKFEELTKKLIDQYDKYEVGGGEHINGQLTLGENIADLGGVRVGYTAFRLTNPDDKKSIEEMTPNQRFFANFARIWRINVKPQEELLLIKTDPHSPGRFRVDGVLPNVPEFFQVYDIKEGNALYTQQDKLVEIW